MNEVNSISKTYNNNELQQETEARSSVAILDIRLKKKFQAQYDAIGDLLVDLTNIGVFFLVLMIAAHYLSRK
ncbi:hypothetical protein BpHYR1_022485 [Brachionus plicatilis]|uniref:Uncharacterized protein n=1 Tax=Brachionus plicatilis TaxID=10195 RepID=A0A3M7PZL8_BRAPC|nr:hypothetical protein BpHYR1_022485 [Brachionus plicatilis]